MESKLAYLLGYFYADGHVQTIRKFRKRTKDYSNYKVISIEVLSDDSKPIIYCLDSLRIEYSLYRRYRSNSDREQTAFRISAKSNYRDIFISVMSDKIDMSTAMSQIPPDSIKYFLRGFFDGDGCINVSKNYRLYFYGSYDQNWKPMFEILDDLNIKYTYQKIERKDGRHKSSHIIISNKYGINTLFEYLYPNREYDFGLYRKFQKLSSDRILTGQTNSVKITEQRADIIKVYT